MVTTKILSAIRSKKAPNSDSSPYFLAKNPSKKSVMDEIKNKNAANKYVSLSKEKIIGKTKKILKKERRFGKSLIGILV